MRYALHVLALMFATASIVNAQFAALSAPGNGAKLYFSSSVPLQGSNEPSQGRIFSADAGGVHTIADVPAIVGTQLSNYYALSGPELSRDGTVLIYAGRRDCYSDVACESPSSLQSMVQTTIKGSPGGVMTQLGAGRISGNGRYLLLSVTGVEASSTLVDLTTGQSQVQALRMTPDGVGRVVADDGTSVFAQGTLVVARGASLQTIFFDRGYAQQGVIDSAARTVVYVQYDPLTLHRSLHAYSLGLPIGLQQDLLLFTQGENTAPFVSADGARAMFISTASGSAQMWIINTDSTGAQQVTNEPTGVLSAAMSDDGTTGWYVAGSGLVKQVNFNSGVVQTRIGRTPNLLGGSSALSPGTAWTLIGSGFSDTSFAAPGYLLPPALGGVTVSIGGIPAPIFSVGPTQIVIQVPWELPAEQFTFPNTPVVIDTTTASPFAAAELTTLDTPVKGFGVFIHDSADPYILAVHQDWSAVITATNPARPNEILHLYGFNFGPVSSHSADGMPAVASPLPSTITPIACSALGADNATKITIPVLYSGLAPGTAGYYQLDVQLPGSGLAADTTISCTGSGQDSNFNGHVPVKQ
jgi:uncharacterized protein (TIGR03437 family)